MNNQINIELEFLDSLTKNTLTYFVQSNLCKLAKLSKSPIDTDLFIVDFFRVEDDFLIKKTLRNNKFIIILHNSDEKVNKAKNIFSLEKPINTYKLVELISQVQNEIHNSNTQQTSPAKAKNINQIAHSDAQHTHLYNAVNEEEKGNIHLRFKAQKFVGSNKDISNATTATENIFLSKKKYLYHFLVKATKLSKMNESSILLKSYLGNIVYHKKKKTFQHGFEPTQLKYIQTTAHSQEITIEFINEEAAKGFNGEHEINGAEFIWSSSIQASKGRIPKGTNLEQTVHLKAWPNFSKVQVFRYAIQITAVWSKHKMSLIETAKQLQIPQRYVFTLYCAMHAIGYADIDKTIGKNILESNRSKNSSIFSKIINHIFG